MTRTIDTGNSGEHVFGHCDQSRNDINRNKGKYIRMKTYLLPVAAVAFGLSTSLALAEEAIGKITQMDANTGILVLDTGQTFTLKEGVPVEGLQPGTKVEVSFQYDEASGNAVATEVQPQP